MSFSYTSQTWKSLFLSHVLCGLHLISSEAMEKSNEASFGCLQTKNPPYDSQGSGNGTEGSHEQKDEVNAHLVGMESNKPFHRANTSHPNQGYRPFCHQEFWNWPNIYPDIHKLQQSQMNIFENHIYPTNRDYFLPIENRIHYLPYKMFSQDHQHQLQFQDFQYFVVIDFEATCDKERKPHPQEIIEFPSVLVNSVTGQLEASFQTYVRPVYHQLLTDFCKELTGIQQIQVFVNSLSLILLNL